ncbi:hypothetical protein GYMLUDRAFT_236942 [Collybiopsis luxurians FD-317 M1]|nr:hypothetical protein GYMLUDRAFT_236942 [Collybiopsis luxurians FD-317 M1]
MSSQNLTLDKLNIDILYTILLILHDVSRHSLFSTLSTNRTLYNATLPVLHRSCVLDYTDGDQKAETMARVESWLKEDFNSVIFTFIREITTKSSAGSWRYNRDGSDEAPDKWDSLIQMLRRVPHLASFTFDCDEQMPTIILDTLHSYHPTTHLHIRNWTRIPEGRVFGDPAEEALANSPCLRSLQGHFVIGESRRPDYRLQAFDRIVKLSPNLESISRISNLASSCVVYGFSQGDLEIRDAERRKFKVDQPRRKAIKSLEMNFGETAVLKDLATYIDLGQLVTLKKTEPTSDLMFLAAEDPAFQLSSLRHLDIRLYAQDQQITAFQAFLASLSPLESLSVALDTSRPWSSILSAIILHHSTSLKTLSLHQAESAHKESMRVCLTLEELDNIRNSCSELTSLGLDIDRTLDMERERAYYANLHRFINLRELTIHMDLGLAYYSEGLQPFFKQLKQNISDDEPKVNCEGSKMGECYGKANEAFALKVWEEVSQRELARKGVHLLVLCMGEQDRVMGPGRPAYWVRFERSRRHLVTVKRNERDDRFGQVDVKINGLQKIDIQSLAAKISQFL